MGFFFLKWCIRLASQAITLNKAPGNGGFIIENSLEMVFTIKKPIVNGFSLWKYIVNGIKLVNMSNFNVEFYMGKTHYSGVMVNQARLTNQ